MAFVYGRCTIYSAIIAQIQLTWQYRWECWLGRFPWSCA